MDIQSFLLGMGAVLLIVSAVGGVVALVKVGKLKKTVTDNEHMRDGHFQHVNTQFTDVYRTMDSRFDKLENKFSNKLENIKTE